MQGETNIIDVFHNKYQSLYTSVPYNTNDRDKTHHRVSELVLSECHNGSSNCVMNHNVSVSDVLNAVKKMKLNKSDANFELYSNNVIYACEQLFVHLSILFNSMLVHGFCPKAMNVSTLIPIPKNSKKSIVDSNSASIWEKQSII